MNNHKLGLIFATIFLLIHIVMTAMHKQVETNPTYWIIAELMMIACVILFSRVVWEKFKSTLSDTEGYQPTDKLDVTNPPKK